MPVNTLRVAYSPAWVGDPDFSPAVARMLGSVLAQVDSGNERFEFLFPLLTTMSLLVQRRASQRQRMQLLSLLGEICDKLNFNFEAVICYEEALSIAESLGDWGARAELAYRHGSVNSILFNYSDAADYFDLGLDSLCAFADHNNLDPQAFMLEADIQAALAMSKFALADYDAAAHCVKRYRDLASLIPAQPLLPFKAERLDALILRWRGQPSPALEHIREATKYFAVSSSQSSLRSRGRLELETADVLLDIATAALVESGSSTQAATCAEEAAAHIREAQHYADQTSDTIGADLVVLACARQECVARLDAAWIPAIEGILKRARASHDPALAVQAYTALAYVLAAQGEHEASLNCHRAAITAVGDHQVPAIAKWSQNALLATSSQR